MRSTKLPVRDDAPELGRDMGCKGIKAAVAALQGGTADGAVAGTGVTVVTAETVG